MAESPFRVNEFVLEVARRISIPLAQIQIFLVPTLPSMKFSRCVAFTGCKVPEESNA